MKNGPYCTTAIAVAAVRTSVSNQYPSLMSKLFPRALAKQPAPNAALDCMCEDVFPTPRRRASGRLAVSKRVILGVYPCPHGDDYHWPS